MSTARVANRVTVVAMAAVPLLLGLWLSAAEVSAQGLGDWITAARHQRVAACANGTAPPFGEC